MDRYKSLLSDLIDGFDPYRVLEISSDSSDNEVMKAYTKKLSDKSLSATQIEEVQEAFAAVSSRETKTIVRLFTESSIAKLNSSDVLVKKQLTFQGPGIWLTAIEQLQKVSRGIDESSKG